jgi:hypothetical protein
MLDENYSDGSTLTSWNTAKRGVIGVPMLQAKPGRSQFFLRTITACILMRIA